MKIIDDWKRVTNSYTVHFSIYGITWNGICAAIVKSAAIVFPVIGVLQLRYVFIAGAALFGLTLCGRFVCQKPKPIIPIDPGFNP